MRQGQIDSFIIFTWCVALGFCLAAWIGIIALVKSLIGVLL